MSFHLVTDGPSLNPILGCEGGIRRSGRHECLVSVVDRGGNVRSLRNLRLVEDVQGAVNDFMESVAKTPQSHPAESKAVAGEKE